MPRKSKKKQPESPAGMAATEPDRSDEAVSDFLGAQRREIERPTGPRKRSAEDPRTVYTGPNITLTLDGGDTYNLESRKPLTREQADKAVAAGFDDVSDDGTHWQANKLTVQQTGKDINVLAVMLDQKGERLAQGRER